MHTTILLMAAKLLKQCESELKGCVKLVFQPAEELLVGGKTMVNAGILQNPTVDASIALYVALLKPIVVVLSLSLPAIAQC